MTASSSAVPTKSADMALALAVREYYADPSGFVRFAYPWRQPGPLAEYDGPDDWQRDVLDEIGQQVRANRFDGVHPVAPIREAVSSGHGIGKGVLSAWLTDWILSTRPHSQGTVTANTGPQLEAKTWATIQKWTRLCLTARWFDIGATRIKSILSPDSWFVSALTCRDENTESFAGQHAASSTSWYLFDEASAIPDAIWEVAEGGLSDGEPMFFAWGNPTRNAGKFHRIVFGSERARWTQHVIDSRTCHFPNQALIEEWRQDHGEDSDFFRVRVRGLAPSASDLQYIDQERVFGAQQRHASPFPDEPLVAGLDVARGGMDNNVIRFRRGPDAKTIKPIKVPGEESRDSMRLVSLAADVLGRTFDGRKVATLFVDETGIGGPIVDRLKQLGHKNVVGVQFGAAAPDPKMANMRAFIWSKLRDWLPRGMIDSDPQLEADLTGPGYHHDKRDRLVLEAKEEMKKRGLASPDDADGLALTFAAPVAVKQPKRPAPPVVHRGPTAWMS